jgi:hypothetical protein
MTTAAKFPAFLGEIHTEAPANPGAGNVYGNLVVPTGFVYCLYAMQYRVATDATVTNRYPRVFYGIGGVDSTRHFCNSTIQQNQTVDVSFALGWGFADANGAIVAANDRCMGLPLIFVPAAGWFRVGLKQIQAGDVLTSLKLHFLRWRV